jgi:hypothetical protein
MFTDARTMKSDTFFRFTVAARRYTLPTLANIQQWQHESRTNCQKCNRDLQPTLAQRLNGCARNMTEMTRRHNKIVDVIRRAIEQYMAERLLLKIGDNKVIRDKGLSEKVRSLRPDLSFVTRTVGSGNMVPIDISCPDGRISYRANTLEKVYIDKKEKCNRRVQETRKTWKRQAEIIPIIVSPLGAVHARSIEALRNLFSCNDKKMKKIGRRVSEAVIMGSMEIRRRYARDTSRTEDARVI